VEVNIFNWLGTWGHSIQFNSIQYSAISPI